MDWLYDVLFVRPVVAIAHVNKSDAVDAIYRALAWLGRLSWRGLSITESGRVRLYAAGIGVGAVVYMALLLFL
jgi:NADH-quinone oxidoreductase subunit L